MTEQVSQCPNCETSFMVSAAQLRAADGAVRCGACLQVFQAADYFVEAPIPDLFSEVEADGVDEDLEREQALEAVDPDDADATELATENSFCEEEELLQTESYPAESSIAESVSTITEDDGAQTGEHESADSNETASETEAPEAEALIESEQTASDIAIDQSVGVHQHDLDEVDESSISDGLRTLEDSTVEELVPEYEAMPARNTLRWFAAALLLVVALGGQYLWFEREIYSAEPMLRPYYGKVCNTFNCTLPEMSDVQQLQTDDLVVRSMSDPGEGLVVDVLLRNEAPFRQRFPGLLLQFSTIQGDMLAQRIFRPEQYLAGEMAGLIFVPASTEVRLSLEIVDPGPDAVGYSMMAVAID